MIATRDETGRRSHAAALGAAGWLGLAATPTFALMALLTCVPGGEPDMMCSAAHGVSPLSGMVPMYVLMSAFHSAPWLKLIFGRRSGARRLLINELKLPYLMVRPRDLPETAVRVEKLLAPPRDPRLLSPDGQRVSGMGLTGAPLCHKFLS